MVGLMFSYRAFITRNIMFEDHSLASFFAEVVEDEDVACSVSEMTESVSLFPREARLDPSSIADAVVNTVR